MKIVANFRNSIKSVIPLLADLLGDSGYVVSWRVNLLAQLSTHSKLCHVLVLRH